MMEIEKLELEAKSESTKSGVDNSVASDERGEKIIEGNDPEGAEVIEENLPNDRCISDSISQSCSVDNHSEEREIDKDVTEENSELPATTEDILQNFYESFRGTIRQLKRNDATLLGLFREQNEIFKTQSYLMKKLMTKNLTNK